MSFQRGAGIASADRVLNRSPIPLPAALPRAVLGAIGRAARAGAIIKGGVFLEQLGRVSTVVLDKTGTLTFGQPEGRTLIPIAGADSMALLDAPASAELRSEHPLSETIIIRDYRK